MGACYSKKAAKAALKRHRMERPTKVSEYPKEGPSCYGLEPHPFPDLVRGS